MGWHGCNLVDAEEGSVMKLMHWLALLTMVAGLSAITDICWWKSGFGSMLAGLTALLSLVSVIAKCRRGR